MNRASFFIANKALFGSYPSIEGIKELHKNKVKYFIDLTYPDEKGIHKYKTDFFYLNFPIRDHRVPRCWRSFAKFIIQLAKIIKNLKNNEKIYIHCRGGHGRSGVVVASLLCYMKKISPSEAISQTTKYHNQRVEMRDKWRKLGSPQTRSQKHFVTKFFEPLLVYKNYSKYFSTGFNNDSRVSVNIPKIGRFSSATLALKHFKDIITASCTDESDKYWKKIRKKIMYHILKNKFSQHIDLYNNLTSTGLRPIKVVSSDKFWGIQNFSGSNETGNILEEIRIEFYINFSRLS
jgi:hypothetical protein